MKKHHFVRSLHSPLETIPAMLLILISSQRHSDRPRRNLTVSPPQGLRLPPPKPQGAGIVTRSHPIDSRLCVGSLIRARGPSSRVDWNSHQWRVTPDLRGSGVQEATCGAVVGFALQVPGLSRRFFFGGLMVRIEWHLCGVLCGEVEA